MKIIHVHPDGGIDASSPYSPDPEAVKVSGLVVVDRVMAGIEARWGAIATEECTCGAEVIRLNRTARRRIRANFEGYVQHVEPCPAMDGAVRTFCYQYRSMSR